MAVEFVIPPPDELCLLLLVYLIVDPFKVPDQVLIPYRSPLLKSLYNVSWLLL